MKERNNHAIFSVMAMFSVTTLINNNKHQFEILKSKESLVPGTEL